MLRKRKDIRARLSDCLIDLGTKKCPIFYDEKAISEYPATKSVESLDKQKTVHFFRMFVEGRLHDIHRTSLLVPYF